MKGYCLLLSIVIISIPLFMTGCKSTENTAASGEPEATGDAAIAVISAFDEKPASFTDKVIAVSGFEDLRNGDLAAGRIFAERLTTQLVNSGYTVVERSRLDSLMDEQELEMSGMTEQDTAAELGRLANAEIIVTGSIIENSGIVEITARAVNVEDGTIICAATVCESKEQELRSGTAAAPDLTAERTAYRQVYERYMQNYPDARRRERAHMELMQKMKNQEPQRFNELTRKWRWLMNMADRKPRQFMLVTEPEGSVRLRQWLNENSDKRDEVQKIRRQIADIGRQDPFIIDLITIKRMVIIDRNGN